MDAMIPRRFMESQREPLLVAYCLFFAAVCGMGFCFSYKNWKRDKGKIFEEIRRMLQELESQPEGDQ